MSEWQDMQQKPNTKLRDLPKNKIAITRELSELPKTEQNRLAKLNLLLDELRRGVNVQNRRLATWLTEAECEGFESDWESQLQSREELNDKPDELKAPQRKALGLTNKELRYLVLKRHAPIADQLTSNIGGDLQFLDSRIAELVINTLREDDIVVLPIHDSFIVRRGYRSWLETVMKAASKAIIDASVPVRDDGARLIKHFGMDKEQYKKRIRES
jgi:hypothetical protein